MGKERGGYGKEVSPLELIDFDTNFPKFKDLDVDEVVNVVSIDNKKGFFRLRDEWERRGLTTNRIRGIAKKYAPQEATHYIPIYVDPVMRTVVAGIQYYTQAG